MEIIGSGGSTGRKIGDLVYKHVSAPQDELTGLVRANGRVLSVAGNEKLFAVIGSQFALPATNFQRVYTSGAVNSVAYWNGFWYAHVTGIGIIRSATGASGTWVIVNSSTGSTNNTSILDSDFAILNGKLFLWHRYFNTSTATLLRTTDGTTWTVVGNANNYTALGLTTTITGGGSIRMRPINGKLVWFGGAAGTAYITYSEDEGVTFTASASAIATRINAMAESNGKIVAALNSGGIQTADAIVANNGWTARTSGVTEALNVITTTAAGVTRIVGASGRTLTSADQINFATAQAIDGVTSPIRMIHLSGLDIMLASSSALDSNRRINVSMDFNSWRSEKVAGQTMMTSFNGIATDGSKIAVAGSSGLDMTAALAFNPATEFWVPNFDPGGDIRAYFVASV